MTTSPKWIFLRCPCGIVMDDPSEDALETGLCGTCEEFEDALRGKLKIPEWRERIRFALSQSEIS